MPYLFGLMCLLALGIVGCSETTGTEGTGLCEGVTCDDGNQCTKDECSPADGSCSNTAVEDDSFCDAGYCQSGECEPIASIFPCTEQGILDAIAEGGGPHGFACNGPTVVTTTAEIVIDHDVILDGRDDLMVDGNDEHVVFAIPADVEAELRRITVSGGFTPGRLEGSGGGIANEGTLKMTRCMVSRNSAGETGSAGIWNGRFASLMLTNSAVSENTGGQVGFGGIWNTGVLVITNGTISKNSAGAFGVNAILNDAGTLTLTNSTVSENSGAHFGAIVNNSLLSLTNSTVSGNHGETCGALLNGGGATSTIVGSTVSGNTSESGASIVNFSDEFMTGVLMISNSVIEDDCIGWREGSPQGSPDIVSSGYNIESPGDTCGFDHGTDLVNITEEQLDVGPLADNVGPTMTHALLPGSVAIDHIPAVNCELTEDQRGQPRPETGGTMCDVGAFEVQP